MSRRLPGVEPPDPRGIAAEILRRVETAGAFAAPILEERERRFRDRRDAALQAGKQLLRALQQGRRTRLGCGQLQVLTGLEQVAQAQRPFPLLDIEPGQPVREE